MRDVCALRPEPDAESKDDENVVNISLINKQAFMRRDDSEFDEDAIRDEAVQDRLP